MTESDVIRLVKGLAAGQVIHGKEEPLIAKNWKRCADHAGESIEDYLVSRLIELLKAANSHDVNLGAEYLRFLSLNVNLEG